MPGSRALGLGKVALAFPVWDGNLYNPLQFNNTFSREVIAAGLPGLYGIPTSLAYWGRVCRRADYLVMTSARRDPRAQRRRHPLGLRELLVNGAVAGAGWGSEATRTACCGVRDRPFRPR